jgi:hypothetical protein
MENYLKHSIQGHKKHKCLQYNHLNKHYKLSLNHTLDSEYEHY